MGLHFLSLIFVGRRLARGARNFYTPLEVDVRRTDFGQRCEHRRRRTEYANSTVAKDGYLGQSCFVIRVQSLHLK
jgi:hypothetical protein